MERSLRNAKIQKYIDIVESYCYHDYIPLAPLNGSMWEDKEPEVSSSCIERLVEGQVFGGARKNFRIKGSFQAEHREACDTILLLKFGNSKSLEALSFLYGPEAVVSIDGEAVSGMDPNHSELILKEKFLDKGQHDLEIEGWTGIKEEIYEIGRIGICYRNRCINSYVQLCRLCLQTAELTEQEFLYNELLKSLQMLDLYEPLGQEFECSAETASNQLQKWIKDQGIRPQARAALCGHGHLDLAWLWRTEQSKKKGARTFLNVLGIMERHPKFRYSQTQAQLYQWMEEERPEIFEAIRSAVKNEKWEILGGMWVEPDCNLTGAESMVRQFLLFHSYMNSRFSTSGSPVVWLPDTFGFCGQLPQIMQDAGYTYFATAKLTWNQYNKMPSEAFWWEGIDGSRVLSYLVSTSKPGWWGATYSADLTPEELITTEKKQESRGVHDEILIAYGMGDGGGGPTEEMVGRGELIQEHEIWGLPAVEFTTFQDFFDRLREKAGQRLPVWSGELYFELHRGTYTSQSEVKKNNRLCESALHQAEFLAAFASEETDYVYPGQQFHLMWEKVCLNQFHDILPGSSIRDVYEDAREDHKQVLMKCRSISNQAVKKLQMDMPDSTEAVVINSTSFHQTEVIPFPLELKDGQCIKMDGKILKSACFEGRTYVKAENIPPYGYAAMTIEDKKESEKAKVSLFAGCREDMAEGFELLIETKYVLYNEKILIEFDENGDILNYFDRVRQRVISDRREKFMEWRMYEDRPADWDAWDLDEDYKEKGFRRATLETVKIFCIEDLQAGFYMTKCIGNSKLIQKISIEEGSFEISMKVMLEYEESNQHLRLDFPVQIHNSCAEYGTQFGSVKRSTHENTSWDKAKFETCMHRWADYSEGNYGVALLCDNKYGVSIHDGIISLAVSKSAGFPDPKADRGMQEFRVIICPHKGSERSEIIRKSCLIDHPLDIYIAEGGGGTQEKKSMVHSVSDDVVIETVKKAENHKGIIIRAYECSNSRGKTRFMYYDSVKEATACTILEDEKKSLLVDGKSIEKEYRPYEIMTIKIQGGKNESADNAEGQGY